MKTLLIFVGTVVGILLTLAVVNGTNSTDCEHLYNEYSATSDMVQRDILWSKGINNGCFHSN